MSNDNLNLYDAAKLLKQHCGLRPCNGCIFYHKNFCVLQRHAPVTWDLSMFSSTQEDTQEEND